jgi:predicted GNAT family acetyltransferase
VDHQLVAVAGERLGFNGYTEVSGICTLPDFRGRGYAHDLTSYVCDLNVKAGHQVFLHALHSNTRAIAVYEHLGFKLRRRFPIWKIRKL